MVPDVTNPRFSYGGGKIISELLAFNYGRKHFDRVVIFRPHNVYGPNMGEEHVIPQFAMRMDRAFANTVWKGTVSHSGNRAGDASVHVHRRLHRGLVRVIERGLHLNVYNIGAPGEVTMAKVAHLVAACFEREIEIGQARCGQAAPPAGAPTPRSSMPWASHR